MGTEWYVVRDGETFGPFTSDRMSEGVRAGELRREDLVWCEGMPNCQPASEVAGVWRPPPLPLSKQANAGGQTSEPERPENPQAVDNPTASGEGSAGGKIASRQAGFILRHWRGQLTLAEAYWGVGCLLTFPLILLSMLFGEWLGKADLPPVGTGLTLFSFLLLVSATTIWQLVGIWRAAANHIASTGRRAWAIAARLIVLIGAVRAIVDFSTVIWPMLSESAILASGRDNTPAYQLRLLRDDTELELAGGMPFGTADALRKLLDAAPGVQVVHLNSIGGRVGEGYQIFEIVRERKLATYTVTDCVSACTIAFLGGTHRYLSPSARLGFHSQSFGGLDQKQLPEINANLRETLTAQGAPAWFIDKALSTGADSMWYPPNQDLIAANIVTSIVDPDRFGMSGITNWRDKEGMERQLAAIPFYASVRDNDPEGFKKIATRFSEDVKLGKSATELIQDMQAVFRVDILPKYLQVAPDAVIQRYWRTQVAEMEHLSKTDPALCVAYAFPERRRADFNLNKLVPAALLAEDGAALAELIEQAIRAPLHQNDGNFNGEFDGIMTRISARIPTAKDVLSEPSRHFNDPGMLCAVTLAFYTEVLNLPPSRSGQILRAFAESTR